MNEDKLIKTLMDYYESISTDEHRIEIITELFDDFDLMKAGKVPDSIHAHRYPHELDRAFGEILRRLSSDAPTQRWVRIGMWLERIHVILTTGRAKLSQSQVNDLGISQQYWNSKTKTFED